MGNRKSKTKQKSQKKRKSAGSGSTASTFSAGNTISPASKPSGWDQPGGNGEVDIGDTSLHAGEGLFSQENASEAESRTNDKADKTIATASVPKTKPVQMAAPVPETTNVPSKYRGPHDALPPVSQWDLFECTIEAAVRIPLYIRGEYDHRTPVEVPIHNVKQDHLMRSMFKFIHFAWAKADFEYHRAFCTIVHVLLATFPAARKYNLKKMAQDICKYKVRRGLIPTIDGKDWSQGTPPTPDSDDTIEASRNQKEINNESNGTDAQSIAPAQGGSFQGHSASTTQISAYLSALYLYGDPTALPGIFPPGFIPPNCLDPDRFREWQRGFEAGKLALRLHRDFPERNFTIPGIVDDQFLSPASTTQVDTDGGLAATVNAPNRRRNPPNTSCSKGEGENCSCNCRYTPFVGPVSDLREVMFSFFMDHVLPMRQALIFSQYARRCLEALVITGDCSTEHLRRFTKRRETTSRLIANGSITRDDMIDSLRAEFKKYGKVAEVLDLWDMYIDFILITHVPIEIDSIYSTRRKAADEISGNIEVAGRTAKAGGSSDAAK